jgi:hypothetical protein
MKSGSRSEHLRTVSQLDQCHRGSIYQLLQYDHIYRLIARTIDGTIRQLNLQSTESCLPPWEQELSDDVFEDIMCVRR